MYPLRYCHRFACSYERFSLTRLILSDPVSHVNRLRHQISGFLLKKRKIVSALRFAQPLRCELRASSQGRLAGIRLRQRAPHQTLCLPSQVGACGAMWKKLSANACGKGPSKRPVIGAVLAPGERSMAAIVSVMGYSDNRLFQDDHRVLNRAK